LPIVDVRELEIFYGNDYATSKIKAATYGRGLWQSDLIETTGVFNPSGFAAASTSPTAILLNWVKNTSNSNVMIACNTSNIFGVPTNGTTYAQGTGIPGGGTVIYNGSATSFNHSPLANNTLFYYKIWSCNTLPVYSLEAIANATTLCTLVTVYPWYEGLENAGTGPLCWSQESIIGTKNWLFQNGGYTGGYYPSTAHTGYYNATLYVQDYTHPVTKLITPPINLMGITNPVLRFWHTQVVWGTNQDELRVYYRTSITGGWNLLATYTSNIPAWTQESIQLPNPAPIYFVCSGNSVTFIATTTNGGINPIYQWKVNGTNAGTNNSSYSFIPINGDIVTCMIISNVACPSGNPATSNTVTMLVDPTVPTSGTNVSLQHQITWHWNAVSGAIGYKWNTSKTIPPHSTWEQVLQKQIQVLFAVHFIRGMYGHTMLVEIHLY